MALHVHVLTYPTIISLNSFNSLKLYRRRCLCLNYYFAAENEHHVVFSQYGSHNSSLLPLGR